MARNLLKNPSGEGNMGSWEITATGGDGWRVEEMPGGCGHSFYDDSARKYFVTSHGLCLKKQVVDLLAEGFQADILDAQPLITVEDWYSGRTDCGCIYQLTVTLLDKNRTVMQTFQPGEVTLDSENSSWRQVTHWFSDYGPGLRYISFEHGGKDTQYWAGWYGVRVTGSTVMVFG